MKEQLLKGNDVAKILRVSRSFAYLLMKRGDVPAVHIGNAIRVRPEDLEEYILERRSLNETALNLLHRKT
ncbi:MAG TPA: helix-turn-helix domain-containing protein [Anaerolineales bacterium]|nr:helix-turn-helix domain-containing protein [Anaerolineales bacterium]